MRTVAKAGLGAAAAVVLVSTGFQVAQAVTEPSVPTYTGCLAISGTHNGKLFAIATGSSPTRGCTSTEKLVKLSSGDITSVAGGQAVKVTSTEVGTPDTNGSVSLDLAPQYKLPQGCSDGQFPVRNGSSWDCQSTLGRARVGTTGVIDLPLGEDWTVVGDGMTLPPGSYTLVAKVMLNADVTSDEEGTSSMCRLDATGTPGIDKAAGVIRDTPGTQTLPLAAAVTRSVTFRVAVLCHDFAGSEVDASWLRIVATPVLGYDNENLGD